jgi:hypothetical protein
MEDRNRDIRCRIGCRGNWNVDIHAFSRLHHVPSYGECLSLCKRRGWQRRGQQSGQHHVPHGAPLAYIA